MAAGHSGIAAPHASIRRCPWPRTWWRAASIPPPPSSSGPQTSPTYGPGKAGCMWPWSWICTPSAWSVGPWPIICAPTWSWRHSPWRWGNDGPSAPLVHHSDRGCQYASARCQQAMAQQGITCRMSRRGDCWDNAVVESCFATLKGECLDRRPWPTQQEARLAIHEYIGMFYNRHRRHSSLDYQSPACYEETYAQEAALAA